MFTPHSTVIKLSMRAIIMRFSALLPVPFVRVHAAMHVRNLNGRLKWTLAYEAVKWEQIHAY
ncbi:MAG: hypothetical protein IJR50_01575, partial [Treponema sp.]|nr:hypothetical protein [Treponema sp.]